MNELTALARLYPLEVMVDSTELGFL